jgi:hypothetical protein
MVNGRRADENATPPLDKVNPPFGQGHRSQGGPRRSHATSATNRGKPVGPSVRECGERIETGLGSTGSLASTPAEVASCRFICSSRAEAEADDTQQRVTDRADADEDEHTGHGHGHADTFQSHRRSLYERVERRYSSRQTLPSAPALETLRGSAGSPARPAPRGRHRRPRQPHPPRLRRAAQRRERHQRRRHAAPWRAVDVRAGPRLRRGGDERRRVLLREEPAFHGRAGRARASDIRIPPHTALERQGRALLSAPSKTNAPRAATGPTPPPAIGHG